MPSSDLGFYDINDYLSSVTPARDPILTEMENYGRKHNFPIVGPTAGSFLHQMVLLTNPKRIFEMGSGFGYSAYWMAKALNDPDAKIICTEDAPKNATCAMSYFERGGVADKIDIKIGNALKIIEETTGFFDIIYNDIDKHEYPTAFEKAAPRLRKGGLFITDNLIWHGRVMDKDNEPSTIGVRELTRLLYESDQFFTTIIPLRDGLAVAVKL